MADLGRLDELKRKFDENPKRYFAPLANEFRKAGDPERAIELCRTYLPQQPTHMSGYIVYGQALHDAGKPDESAAVFKQALTLDPENIIALRQLGDIARTAGDAEGAARWYGKVLELDPRNEEVIAYVGSVSGTGASVGRSGPERPAPPAVRPEPEPDDSAVRLADIVSEPDAEQGRIAPRSGDETESQAAADEPVGAWEWPAPGSQEALPAEETLEVAELMEAAEVEPIDFEAEAPITSPPPLEGPWHPEPAGQDGEAQGAPLNLADFMPEEPAAFAPTPDELGHAPVPSASPAAPTSMESVFVTETMAELYIQQGLPDEALRIYRALMDRRDDPALQRRIAEIEAASSPAGAARETVRDFFARIGAKRPTERLELAADRTSPLETLFGEGAAAGNDVDAAQRLSGAFGAPRSGNPRS